MEGGLDAQNVTKRSGHHGIVVADGPGLHFAKAIHDAVPNGFPWIDGGIVIFASPNVSEDGCSGESQVEFLLEKMLVRDF
jgi:hypothetical protein